MTISITLQYFDGCPHWKHTDRDLNEAIDLAGVDASINYQKVGSQSEADRLMFRGSPTILISGRDPFADPDAPTGLSCRVYRTGEKLSGSPGVAALQAALRDAGA
ncbi:MAG: thioredoxin family protein [Actinomycetota bacterium]